MKSPDEDGLFDKEIGVEFGMKFHHNWSSRQEEIDLDEYMKRQTHERSE